MCGAGKVTPYSLGATEAFDMVFNGGKQDDITVVVAMLCAPSLLFQFLARTTVMIA